jgi:hypothetical protein
MQAGANKQVVQEASSGEAAIVDAFLRQVGDLLKFDQAACVIAPFLLPAYIAGLANVTTIDQSSPYCVWVKKLFAQLDRSGRDGIIDTRELPVQLDGSKFAPGQMLFVSVDLRAGVRAGFFFMRVAPWSDVELSAARALTQDVMLRLAYARRFDLKRFGKLLTLRRSITAVGIAAVALFPVHLASVAPAEVIPLEPSVISSSLAGVVRTVHVRSNEAITPGQLLVSLDDVDQRNKRDFAQRDLELTRAELKRLEQLGFLDPTQRFRLGELEAQLRIRELELARANQELARMQIRAERDGIAIVGEASEWAGRPVQIGEKILQIADPVRTALRIYIPAADLPVLDAEQEGEVYLDSQPWDGLSFVVKHWTFEPEVTATGVVAFRAQADWKKTTGRERLGLRGSAHLKGRMVPLLVYLLRRPLILLRQGLAL